jgi:hypothetical protein
MTRVQILRAADKVIDKNGFARCSEWATARPRSYKWFKKVCSFSRLLHVSQQGYGVAIVTYGEEPTLEVMTSRGFHMDRDLFEKLDF